jgi:hypothetical protein
VNRSCTRHAGRSGEAARLRLSFAISFCHVAQQVSGKAITSWLRIWSRDVNEIVRVFEVASHSRSCRFLFHQLRCCGRFWFRFTVHGRFQIGFLYVCTKEVISVVNSFSCVLHHLVRIPFDVVSVVVTLFVRLLANARTNTMPYVRDG